MKPVRVLNMTRLFSKEMFIYSFFDIKLSKPARVATIGYFFGISAIMSLLMWVVFHLPINLYTLVIVFGSAIGGATTMVKPIWNGRKFFPWVKVQFSHLGEAKLFCDGWKTKPLKDYDVDFDVFVSRRRDFRKLREMRENEK